MREFLSSIGSLYWWISVVIVGILINLASAYLKSRLDERLSKASSWWRKRSEAQKAQRQKEIDKLKDNFQEQVFFAFDSLRNRIRGLYYLVGASLGFIMDGIMGFNYKQQSLPAPNISWLIFSLSLFLMLWSTIGVFLSYREFKSAVYKHNLLYEARKLESDGAKA